MASSVDPALPWPAPQSPGEAPQGLFPALPMAAIVGRPNVGKSTLFNRLAGERLAIVADEPGTTRDRVVARLQSPGGPILLVDTGGLVLEGDDPLLRKVSGQVMVALEEAHVLVFLVDGVSGLHPEDAGVADLLRRSGKPVVLAVSKCEGRARIQAAAEFYRLGLGEPLPISALSNEGIADLVERLEAALPQPRVSEAEAADVLRLAVVGRPNVGKSSLVNAISGQERAIVNLEPGTTRDALDTDAVYMGRPLTLIDTAGIRRRGRIEPGVERFSSLRALQAIERCNVAVLLVDAQEMMTAQDNHVAGYVVEAYRGLVVAVNKWDLAMEAGLSAGYAVEEVRRRLHWASYVPVHLVSALTGQGIPALMETAFQVFQERGAVVEAEALDRLLKEAIGRHAPPSQGRRHLRFYKVSQTGAHPPTFTFYVNDPQMVHFSYQRYLQNCIRSEYGFRGSLLRLRFQKRARAGRR